MSCFSLSKITQRLCFVGLVFASIAYAAKTADAACTITVSPDSASVQAAVNAAKDGDVICLTAGIVNYDTGVALGTKAVEIQGAGTIPSPWGSAGQTIIHLRGTGIAFSGYESTGHSTTIDNIRFTYGPDSAGSNFGVITWNLQGGVSVVKPWIIHHNDFVITGTCGGGRMIETGAHGGIISRNKFTAEIITTSSCNSQNTNLNAIAQFITDDGSWWSSPSTLGAADTSGTSNLYIETNYFENFNVAIDGDTSSRSVWRFNEMHNASMADHGYDSSVQGERHSEVYNNTWVCDAALQMSSYIGFRGGTHIVFNDKFPPFDISKCGTGSAGGTSPIAVSLYRLIQCTSIGGWPGSFPDNYPLAHQVGWGWINGSNQTAGASNAQGIPGLRGYPRDGFQQALEPTYIFNNTNNTGNPLLDRANGYFGTCRAMAYSNTGKTSGTTLIIPNASAQANPYVNVGQEAVVVFSDLVGGSTPTIADNLGNSWSPLTGGTNGSQRLTAWHSHIAHAGAMVVTVMFGSSSAARAGTLVVMRGMTASPVDVNPAVTINNASPYQGPSSGTLAQTNEIVLGYYALNGPIDDNINATNPDTRATSCDVCAGTYNVGISGTTGDTATTNTVVGVTYRAVTSTSAIQPQITNGTADRNGITGTIAFMVTSNDNKNLDLQVTDFVQPDREYYLQTGSFDGTSGTGSGPRSSRPSTCTTGVAYWSTDQGEWDPTHAGNDGVLDKCTATNTWTNGWYTPYTYPHPLSAGSSVGPSVTLSIQ